MTSETTTIEEIRQSIEGRIARFKASQPESVQASRLTVNSKIPYQLLGARELIFVRATDLADTAWGLFKQGRVIPSYVLMRACIETCCLAHYLNGKTAKFLRDQNDKAFHQLLRKILGGSRENPSSPVAVNVLTVIDHIDKEYDGFRKMYDVMCEYAHPNYSGLLAAYGNLDGKFELRLGQGAREVPEAFGLAPFSMALSILEYEYHELGDAVVKVNEHFERT